MNTSLQRVLSIAIVVLVVFADTPSARGKRIQVDSRWRDHDVVVDGSDAEWAGPLVSYGDLPLSVAATNDGEFLYVVLTTSDQAVRGQVLRQGLIVWFDNAGKDKHRFGVKYPIGMTFGGFGGRRGSRGLPPDNPQAGAGSQDPQAGGGTQERYPGQFEPPNRLELLGEKKDDTRTYVADEAPGIAVKIGMAEGTLTYELKVPLVKNDQHPYAIDARPGTTIGMGLETPKFERPSGGFGGGGGMGGMGGRRGGGYGGMGGGRRGGMGRFAEVKPIKSWVSLALATH